MSTPEKKESSADEEAKNLRKDIEQTRAEMTATVAAIEHRLDPAELRQKAVIELEHVEAKVKDAVRAGLEEARTIVREELTEAKAAAKEGLNEAKAAARQGLTDAKAALQRELVEAKTTVKTEINEAIETAKTSVREATLGRVEDLATKAGDAMNDTRETLIETMKLNPIPTAIVGVGLAWLLMNRSSANRRRQIGVSGNGYPYEGGWTGAQTQYGNEARSLAGNVTHAASEAAQRVGSVAGQVVERAEHLAAHVAKGVTQATSQVGDGIGGVATSVNHALHDARDFAASAAHQGVEAASAGLHQTTDAAGRLVHQAGDAMVQFGQGAQHVAGAAYGGARDGVLRAERGFESVLETNPLAVGVAVALVGAAIGFALPRTSREDALMGAVRDGAVEKAATYAKEATQSLEHLAANVATSAKQAIVQGA